MKTNWKTRLKPGVAVVASLLGLLAAPAAPAADAPASAEALLQQSAHALQSASSLRADFEEVDSYPGTHKDLAQRGSIVLARPGRLHERIQRFRRVRAGDPWASSGNNTEAVSDGRSYTYAFLHPHSTQVRQQGVTGNTLTAALKGLPLLAELLCGGG